MKKLLGLLCALAAAAIVAAPAGGGQHAYRCKPTPSDTAGPFGRGLPPQRAKIGTGHVLIGVVLSAVDCSPLRGAAVQFMQAGPKGYTRATSATVITDRFGRFRFEGPFPTDYGRGPHIHIRVFADYHAPLLTRYNVPLGSHGARIRLILEPESL